MNILILFIPGVPGVLTHVIMTHTDIVTGLTAYGNCLKYWMQTAIPF